MRKVRGIVVAVVVPALLGVAAVSASAQSSANEKPAATDVGITAKEIHIAVIADVDNPIAPNLFKASVDGVKGVAKYINAKGGLAGRKVVVDFYDSKLNANATRNATISACENDVAMVGTSAVSLSSVADMTGCKDSTGAPTGIPDIPFVTTALSEQCSDQSFPIASTQVVCSTASEHPQTFQAPVGVGRYYQKKFGKKLHGIYIFGSDSKSARDSSFASLGALREIGIKSDQDFDVSGFANQSAYTPIVQAIKTNHSNYAQCTSQYACTVLLRKEATLQGVTGVKVWDCAVQCYDKEFLSSGGSDVEGEYVTTAFLPFYSKADQKANKMLAGFVKYTGANKVASYGAYAWAAGIAFRDAVDAAAKKNGVNGVTRKTIFEALNQIHKFDAEGMFAPFDLAGRKPSQCGVMMQVKKGKFVRINPTKPGTFTKCTPKNIVTRKLDLFTGS